MTLVKSTGSTRFQSVAADAVDYDNSSSGLTATDVQEALDTLAGGAAAGTGVVVVIYATPLS